ncbi:undecaprenyl-diphosphate phosphatase [Rhizobium paranaense]|uniref:Undecaprenyl-diphosphatase n=1 Tax=Rhizobium paranaense TaxID=1650438 RepID=A0A7W9D304_9HYPH|nr:undecaprenyl-diphosphate phosphatase [Rhizobium paranaense]MBB5575436.1 undecaprenyl-diphosphatase [Rhizobium paranaense]
MADTCTQGIDTGFVALGYTKTAILGVVQGLTELLPISSTAHMRLVPALLGWEDPGSAFSAAMQLAALAAIVSYFWSDVRYVAFGSVAAVRQGNWSSPALRLAFGIVVATVPIVIAGVLLSSSLNACGTPIRHLWVIGVSCLVMAILLALAELYCRHRRDVSSMSIVDALIVGLAQVGALFPGVSRSGSTLTAALFLDFKRDEAARFSFLLGLPAITLAGLKELFELYRAHLSLHAWSILAVGLIVGSLSSFATIWGLMRFLERFSTWPFVIYRALLGIVILAGVFYAGWV